MNNCRKEFEEFISKQTTFSLNKDRAAFYTSAETRALWKQFEWAYNAGISDYMLENSKLHSAAADLIKLIDSDNLELKGKTSYLISFFNLIKIIKHQINN